MRLGIVASRFNESIAAELLMAAAQRDITVLDEKLYLQVIAAPETRNPRRTTAGAR